MPNTTNFCPDWVSAPGRTVLELLRHRSLSFDEFAESSSLGPDDAHLLIDGKLSITVELAERLHQSVGGSVEFWLARDYQYREDSERLFGHAREWVRELPVSDMRRFGWLDVDPTPADEAECCLEFFGVDSVEQWHRKYDYLEEAVLFKRSESYESRPAAVAAWLRQGERVATNQECRGWNATRFEQALFEIRKLTREKDTSVFLPSLRKHCADCGVVFVIVRTPSGCPASGATRFLDERKAVLMLSFRHLTDDHFWFSFFHESAHLLLHHPNQFLIEGVGDTRARLELEANEFAEEVIVPAEHRAELLQLKSRSMDIIRFARKVGVSPGLIVGQLQHKKVLGFNQQNRLKRRYDWSSLEMP